MSYTIAYPLREEERGCLVRTLKKGHRIRVGVDLQEGGDDDGYREETLEVISVRQDKGGTTVELKLTPWSTVGVYFTGRETKYKRH